MWQALYKSGNLGEVVLQPGNPSEQAQAQLVREGQDVSDWHEGIGDKKRWEVPLGSPLVSLSIDDVEDEDKLNNYRAILASVINLDQQNIVYRRLGFHFSRWPLNIQTNILANPSTIGLGWAGNPTPGKNISEQLRELVPFISVLAFNLRLQGNIDGLKNLKSLIMMMPKSDTNFLQNNYPEMF